MVEERLKLEKEAQEIMSCVDQGVNFLLSGGAGSGKTFSLVQVIRQVLHEKPLCKVACMTYTNAAVREIEERVKHPNLSVSTIHDFLWDNIKHFQAELKGTIVYLVNEGKIKAKLEDDSEQLAEGYFESKGLTIQYADYVKIRGGIISHDELLIVSNRLFKQYPKLCRIVKDKYPVILIDEYQDTNPKMVEILLEHFSASTNRAVVGFFGDSMQSIYDDGVGSLDVYVHSGLVREIQKKQNRRNPMAVIELANRLRTDGLVQEPSTDETAPNMLGGDVKKGNVVFLHSKEYNLQGVRNYLQDNMGWDLGNSHCTKELNLTHNLIADKAGFKTLMDIYDKDYILQYRDRVKNIIKDNEVDADFSTMTFAKVIEYLKITLGPKALKSISPTASQAAFIDKHMELFEYALNYNYLSLSKIYISKDNLIDDRKQDSRDEHKQHSKRYKLIKHLYRVQQNIILYQTGQYNELMRATDNRLMTNSIAGKRALKTHMEALSNTEGKTIESVINDAHSLGICIIGDDTDAFIQDNPYIYDRVKAVPFSEFQHLYAYLEGNTPYSTQHKTKGSEYDNVLVILDNGGWNNYNFGNLFTGKGSESVMQRTQKIFYVCCTRAKEKLAVYYSNPSADVVAAATEWFGEGNVVEV